MTEYQDMISEIESGEIALLDAKGCVWFCGKALGRIGREFETEEEARKAIIAEMESQQFWPNLYSINDHGNVALLDAQSGAQLEAWV